MKSLILYALWLLIRAAQPDFIPTTRLQKREASAFSCYNVATANILGFSAGCIGLNWPIQNNRGLNIMETMYFALAATNVPDDTVYYAQENIICTVNTPGPNITVSMGGQVGNGLVSGGGSLTFTLNFPGRDFSLCMFTVGTNQDNVTKPITLAEARNSLYSMLTAPAVTCNTCGRAPIGYPNVTNGVAHGMLKIDATTANNCIGKCVGPNSFEVVQKSVKSSASRIGRLPDVVFAFLGLGLKTLGGSLCTLVFVML